MKQKSDDFNKAWAKMIAKAWSDPQFKERLMKNPNEVLEEEGVNISEGKRVILHENTKSTLYLTLPEQPSGELSEEKLEKIAAGHLCNCNCG